MIIKKMVKNDIQEVVKIWYETSIIAHDFIPKHYWVNGKKDMENIYIPNSETYIISQNDEILGFLTMVENYLAAIFIKKSKQKMGYGKSLIQFIKEKKEELNLKVYQKNLNSINFYKKLDFKILKETIDENTGEKEFLMAWKK